MRHSCLILQDAPYEALTHSDASEASQATLYDYLLSVSLREPEVFHKLRQEMADHPSGDMQIAPDQGQFMALQLQLISDHNHSGVGVRSL